MRAWALAFASCLLILINLASVSAAEKLSLTMPAAGEMIISADPSLHQEFGLSYPVTYKLHIPPGSTGLKAYKKHLQASGWKQLPVRTSNDFFNGEEVVRFDYNAEAAYVSVAFDSTSDDIYLRITDNAGQPVPFSYLSICRYYDNRQAVVTVTADDWKEYTNLEFLKAVHTLRSYRLPVTVAIITGGCTANTWQTIQQELDSGYVEAASHTRSHVDPPYPDPTSEIIGSKQDILGNLILPPPFRKGSQGYVYAWVAPFGSTTTENESLVSQARYIIDRGVFASNGTFSAWSASDRRYVMDGRSFEMGPLYGGITDVNTLNSRFDAALASGSIHHILIHPHDLAATDEWSKGYISSHFSYISNRTNVWYTNFGTLYLYHLLQDDAAGPVQIASGAPSIIVQPASVSARAGETATFSVTASGSAPLTYQWQMGGVDIPGAAAGLYTTNTLSQSDSGATFRCVVSNGQGSATSTEATLSVLPAVINTLANGSFESGTTSWNFYSNGSASFSQASFGSDGTKAAAVTIATEGTNVQLYEANVVLQPNTAYRLTFDAYSNSGHDVEVSLSKHVSPFTNYGLANRKFDLGTSWQSYSVTFTTSGFSATVSDGRLWFWMAPYDAPGDQYYIDNVVLARVSDLAPPVVSPVFVLQPSPQTVTAGQSATFSVSASGTAPLTYQWQKNGTDIPGASALSYTTLPTTAADSGALFHCRVSNAGGSSTSTDARLTVITPRPAQITLDPRDTTVQEGRSAHFTVAAVGDAPLSYQWQKDGADIAGATLPVFSIGSAAQPDSGASFRCIVSNAVGKDTSAAAFLRVASVPPSIVLQPTAQTVYAGQAATFSVRASGTASLYYQWQKDSINIVGATDSLYTTPPTATSDSGRSFRCVVSNAGGAATSGTVHLTVITPRPARITLAPRDTTVLDGHPARFTVAATGDAPLTFLWQKNGADIPGANEAIYDIASAARSDSGGSYRCIASNAVGKDTSIAALLKVTADPPAITLQPTAQSVNLGQKATFLVRGTGTAPLTYQWQRDTVNIDGATDSLYTTSSTVTADSGTTFRCLLSNIAGSAVSAAARLTVITPYPPVVTIDPRDTTVQEGQLAHFSVAASGTAPLTYQWQKNDSDINGATAALYTVTAPTRADSGATFRCIVSNATGKDTSNAAFLHVLPVPPVIAKQPVSETLNAGQTAVFSVNVIGSGPIVYQWLKDTVAIAGATDSVLTLSAAAADSGIVFRCVISNAAGSVVTAGAVLTVITPYPPMVTHNPRDTTVQEGHVAHFAVTATGTAPLRYQWQKNAANIADANGSTYSIAPAVLADSGASYRCIVSNDQGKDTSDAALLHVMPVPPTITSQPIARTVNVGQTATFSISASGSAPLHYQWQKNSIDISGASDSVHITPVTTAADSGALYRCIVFNAAGVDTGSQATLAVISTYPAVVLMDPHDTTVTDGHLASFTVTATGTGGISYRWQKGGIDISGANGASYTIDAAAFADSGSAFRCIVSNVSGKDTSAAAILRVLPISPVITMQPGSASVIVGYAASFSIGASGTGTLGYQWQRNGSPISGATGSTYTTPITTLSDNNTKFRCVVTNRGGTVTSQEAVLIVNSPPVIPSAIANGTFEGGTTGWSFYSNGAASTAVSTPGSSGSGQAMQIAITTEGTNVQLYQFGITLQPNTSYQVSFDAYSNSGHDLEVSLSQHGSPYTNYGLASRKFDLTSAWQTFTVTFTTSGFSTTVTDARLWFWLAPYDAAGDRYYLDNIQLAKSSDLAPAPPVVTLQPASQTVIAGQSATFSVTATGAAPLSYQWQKNNVDISGATGISYTTLAATRADSGAYYRCKVTNSVTSVFSNAAQLLVITPQPPIVTLEPRDTTVQESRPASFTITASGSTPLTYQWQKNNSDISGATAAIYSVASAARSDSGAGFRCVVSNSAGRDTSGVARLLVLAVPPTIAAHPVNQTVTAGLTATFSVTATGSAPLSYQWQANAVDIPGATTASYVTPAVTPADSGALYRCRVTNSASFIYSNNAQLLVVTPRPALVTVDPHDTTVTEAASASFSLVATGTATIAYQWQKNGTNINGATGAIYNISSAARTDSGAAFRCIVSNSAGKDTSATALLKVLAVPPTITSQPVAQTVTVGQTATFRVTATGSTPLSYQWQKNGTAIPGATSASYTTAATVAADSGSTFRCFVSNSAGSVPSQAVLLNVNRVPAVIPNAIANGTFEGGTTGWSFYSNGAASTAVSTPGSSGSGQAMQIAITTEGTNVQLYQFGITLQPNTSYQVSFDAYSNSGHDLEVSLSQHGSPYTNYGLASRKFDLTSAWQTFTVTFTTSGFSTTVTDGRLWFWLAPYDAAGDRYYLDNIQLAKSSDLAPTAPTIGLQPVAQTVALGKTATFSVTATGSAPLNYQWQKNTIDIPGAVASSYTTPAVTAADSGALFRCVVTNVAGSVISSDALLRVGSGPSITVWAGGDQTFGRIGTPQRWVNILGNVSDPAGVSALTYTLNGGPAITLSRGADQRRLALPGDFNIDIAYSNLVVGTNNVTVTARNALGLETTQNINVTRAPGVVWPSPYNLSWSNTTSLTDSAQVVDGKWAVVPEGVRIVERSYDRLIAIGDTTWSDYEVTTRITVSGFDSSAAAFGPISGGPGVGLLMRWKGHSTNPIAGQPLAGYLPLGCIGWLHWNRPDSSQWELVGNNLVLKSTVRAPAFVLGVSYYFKMQVRTQSGQGVYKLKVWKVSESEPVDWLLSGTGAASDPSSGSFLLLAHHVSATFGATSVIPIVPDPPAAIVSDNFNAGTLNTSLWSVTNPQSDVVVTQTGGRLSIAIPGGVSHDLWTGTLAAPIVLQSAPNTDFTVEAKFDAAQTAQYQFQGIVVRQDDANFLRFDFVRDGAGLRIFSASFASGVATVRHDAGIASGSPLYLRVMRQGNNWTQLFSYDGTTWTTAVTFTQAVAVTSVGPFAGNHGIPATSSPPFTALVDYFSNTAAPAALMLTQVEFKDLPIAEVPHEFVLEGNFPNPFNPSTVVRYGLPEPATVSIIVYSILGQEVARLEDGYRAAGNYQVVWQGQGRSGGAVSSGVYLCRMVATPASGKSYIATKRMVLTK